MSGHNFLRLGMCHLRVERGQIDHNLDEVLRLSREAAQSGADIILHTEMALSGYGFDSRAELLPMALAADSPQLDPVRAICREYGCFLVLGLAELDPSTGLIYNSALMWGPDGDLAARRRKVTAEAKWSAAGPAIQPESVCDTPMGRVGLMVCSEAYYSLLPRSLALAGADLLLVSANWPPTGLNPVELWRLRAMENGVPIAVCNRTGKDERMDSRQAVSGVFAAGGNLMAGHHGPESQVLMAELPLKSGRLDSTSRLERLKGRRPADYAYLAHDLRAVQDLTGFLDLPQPGLLPVWIACPPAEARQGAESLQLWLKSRRVPRGAVVVLPAAGGSAIHQEQLAQISRELDCNLFIQLADSLLLYASSRGGIQTWPHVDDPGGEPRLLDHYCARLGLASIDELIHPESVQVMAKRGCDLVVASTAGLQPGQLDCLAGRSLDQTAVAVASESGGLIAVPPKGHGRWQERRITAGACQGLIVNVAPLRRKVFKDLPNPDLFLHSAPAAERA